MKRFLFPFFLFWVTVSFAQNLAENEQWAYNHYQKKSVYIRMRDGIQLYTTIYSPKDNKGVHAILLNRTPYSIGPYNDKFNARLFNSYWIEYLRKGYVIVQQDVRGKWMSEGVFEDVRPFNPNKKNNETDEASDTYDTAEWLITNIENNNGNIGVFGISYPGFYSTMAALSNHPAIKAVSPQAPVTDWFAGDDFHHNGALCLMDAFNFIKGFGIKRVKPDSVFYGKPYSITNKDNYDFYLKTGAIQNFTKLMGDSISFWKDMLLHPNYDSWWKNRNTRNHVTNVQPAMLVVGGLFDAEDCYGAWNLYKAIENKSKNTENRIVMGPWVHGGWARNDGSALGNVRFGSNTSEWYQNNVEIPFFEQYLNNVNYFKGIAEATIFYTGENTWKELAQWPPANTKSVKYYLAEDGLSDKTPKTIAFQEYTSDPAHPVPYTEDVHSGRTREYMNDDQRFASRRPDVLTYVTPSLVQDITVSGEVIANLTVNLNATDADFVVKIIDVFPEDFKYDKNDYANGDKPNNYIMGGYQMLVRGEIMRGKYRNSLENPVPFTINKDETVRFALPDIAHTFKKGHKMMVQIQSSWFPLMDRNPQQFLNIYQAKDKDFKKATIKVRNNSFVELPITTN